MLKRFAHVKWFSEPPEETAIESTKITELFGIGVAVVSGLVLLKYIEGKLNETGLTKSWDKRLRKYRDWVPTAVRLGLGMSLLFASTSNYVFAPNLELVNNNEFALIDTVQFAAGMFLVVGLWTRIWAKITLGLYLLAFFLLDPLSVFEHVEIVGLSGYLMLEGAGKASVDWRFNLDKHHPMPWQLRKYSLPTLRLFTGIGLATLALSEKILAIPLAQEFLNQHNWNILSEFGVSDRGFILFAGTVELIIGLALVFNVASRLVVTSLLAMFLITALILGPTEIAGHIFAIGLVAAVWVNYDPSIERKRKEKPKSKPKSKSKTTKKK